MNNRTMLVVGDKFSSYVQGKDAVTVSQLKGLLTLPVQLLPSQGRTVFVPGQGMGDDCIRQLLKDAAQSVNIKHFDFSLWHDLPERAPTSMSHKQYPENTLISRPRQSALDQFDLHLLIDENCELMQDHQTGQHVQGMLLIEAARQAMLAVVENFYLPDNDVNYAFVLNDMSVNYNNFAFPMAATIQCRILEKHLDNPRRLQFATEAVVKQCGGEVSSLSFSFSAMDRARISKRESMQANKAHKQCLREFEEQLLDEAPPVRKVENL